MLELKKVGLSIWVTVLQTLSFSIFIKALAYKLNSVTIGHRMKMIAVHALSIFSEKIGFDHSTICIKIYELIFLDKFLEHTDFFIFYRT